MTARPTSKNVEVLWRDGPGACIVVTGESSRRVFRLGSIRATNLLTHAGLAYGVPPSQGFGDVVKSLRRAAARIRVMAGEDRG